MAKMTPWLHHKLETTYNTTRISVLQRVATERVSLDHVFAAIMFRKHLLLEIKRLMVRLTHWKLKPRLSRDHRYYFNPMGIDVSEQDLGSSLNYVNEFFNALPAALTVPVLLVQEQRLQELFSEMLRPQHGHTLIWKPERRKILKSMWEYTPKANILSKNCVQILFSPPSNPTVLLTYILYHSQL